MLAHGIEPIDLLVVNLYPFEATSRPARPYDDCVENIDIGGPAMIRAAAKNHADVAVVVDGADYAAVLDDMAAYDGADHARPCAFGSRRKPMPARRPTMRPSPTGLRPSSARPTPPFRALGGAIAEVLRYGENPHQSGRLLSHARTARPASPRPGRCRASSFPTTTSTTLTPPMRRWPNSIPTRSAAIVIVKHANPCGVAEGATLRDAYAQGAALRSGLGLRRHRRHEPHRSMRTRPRPSSRFSPR